MLQTPLFKESDAPSKTDGTFTGKQEHFWPDALAAATNVGYQRELNSGSLGATTKPRLLLHDLSKKTSIISQSNSRISFWASLIIGNNVQDIMLKMFIL